MLHTWIQCYTYATNLDTVLHVYCKFGYNVSRMLQSWRRCSTYATSLITLRYFGMLILAVFPLGRKPPDLYDNRKFRKNVQTVLYRNHVTKLEPSVFLNSY